jgi:glycosyltransferase involved in cell wall biosynthesis
MRLLIDASNIKAGGGLTHLKELLHHADPEAFGFSEVNVFAPSATLRQLPQRPWLEKEPVPALDKGLVSVWHWRTFTLPALVKQSSALLFIPGSGSSSVPFVTMCQNLLPVQKHEMNRYAGTKVWLRLRLLRWLHRSSYRKANGIIFLNDYCHKAVISDMKVSPKSTTIIPHGIHSRFLRQKSSYSWDGVFKLVYVSIIDVYKHQWNVAAAVMQLNQDGYPVELVLVGPEYGPSRKRLDDVLHSGPESAHVKLMGKLDYQKLDTIYTQMDAVIYASTCETFGMTLLEAMASSMPIACSNRSSMPEMLRDAGVYFDPENIQAIKDAILTLMQDEALRKTLGEKAHSYAQAYRWEKTSQKTFTFLQKTARQCVV